MTVAATTTIATTRTKKFRNDGTDRTSATPKYSGMFATEKNDDDDDDVFDDKTDTEKEYKRNNNKNKKKKRSTSRSVRTTTTTATTSGSKTAPPAKPKTTRRRTSSSFFVQVHPTTTTTTTSTSTSTSRMLLLLNLIAIATILISSIVEHFLLSSSPPSLPTRTTLKAKTTTTTTTATAVIFVDAFHANNNNNIINIMVDPTMIGARRSIHRHRHNRSHNHRSSSSSSTHWRPSFKLLHEGHGKTTTTTTTNGLFLFGPSTTVATTADATKTKIGSTVSNSDDFGYYGPSSTPTTIDCWNRYHPSSRRRRTTATVCLWMSSASTSGSTSSSNEIEGGSMPYRHYGRRPLTEQEKQVWQQKLEEIKQYQVDNNGSSYPPRGDPLRNWADTQRKRYNKDQMYPRRIELLNSIGFQWSKPRGGPKIDWDKMFDRLVEYKERCGDTNVPSSYSEDPQLVSWCYHQKRKYRKGTLDSEEKAKLDAIGFVFHEIVSQEDRWNGMYDRLVEYWKKNNSTIVPQRYDEDLELGKWVNDQRRYYNSNDRIMTPERIEKLEAIGFVWDAHEAAWLELYNRLIEYRQEEGDADVPQKYKKDPELGRWVSRQRNLYSSNDSRMTPERIGRLEAIDFVWNTQEAAWLEMYNSLVEYWKEKGHSDFPTASKEDPELGKWVSRQRNLYSSNDSRMTHERTARLEAIGFVWDAQEAAWLEMYNRLNGYRQEEGDADVPYKYNKDPKLRTWVKNQRASYRNGKLLPDRIEMLEAIGFKWSCYSSPD